MALTFCYFDIGSSEKEQSLKFGGMISKLLIALFAGMLLGTIAYFLISNTIGVRDVASAALSLVGTFLGALFAFQLNTNKENKKTSREKRAALNKALFTLTRQYNAIVSLRREIAPYDDVLKRAFSCPALVPPPYTDLQHDFSELSFLLEVTDPNLLTKLSISQEGFFQTIEGFRVRNQFYVSEVQPLVPNLGKQGTIVDQERMEEVFGTRIFYTAIQQAKNMFNLVERNERDLFEMSQALFSTAKGVFPEDRFVKLVKSD